MNVKNLIISAVLIAAALPVFAQSTESVVSPAENFQSTKTRAQVTAELVEAKQQARADGRSLHDQDWNYPQQAIALTRSRADVQAELADARSQGRLAREQMWDYPVIAADESGSGNENVKTAMPHQSMTQMSCC